MLSVPESLNLSLGELKSCKIGGHVMELSKSQAVSKQIQKKAKEIVEKWSRIVYDINTNYSDIDAENRRYEEVYGKGKRFKPISDSFDEEKENLKLDKSEESANIKQNDIYSHAKIPKKGLFDFTIKPCPEISERKDSEIRNYFGKYNYFDKKREGRKKTD